MTGLLKARQDAVLILEPKVFGDARGFFFESFNQRDLPMPRGWMCSLCRTTTAARSRACCEAWYPEFERSLLWNDPTVGVQWPITGAPQLAGKDAVGKTLGDAENFD